MLISLAPWAALTGLDVAAKPKNIVVSCDSVAADLADLWDHNVFVRYLTLADAEDDTNRDLEIPSYEQRVLDHAELTLGVVYYYRVLWVDIWGNESALASEEHVAYRGSNTDDIDVGAISTTKTKQRSKNYSGTTPVTDTDFVTVAIDNFGGTSVRISWEWIVSARYSVATADQGSHVTLITTLWKKHGSGAKQPLQVVRAKVARNAGYRRKLEDSSAHKNSKVFHDVKPKRGDTTTYGVDVIYRAAGSGVHKAAVRKCELNITYNKR